MVCSANGGTSKCCRIASPLAADPVCFSDDDCTGGKVCAQLAKDDGDAGGKLYGCVKPGDRCAGMTGHAGADGGADARADR